MSIFSSIKKFKDAAVAQVNPFDGGKTWKTEMSRPAPLPVYQAPKTEQAVSTRPYRLFQNSAGPFLRKGADAAERVMFQQDRQAAMGLLGDTSREQGYTPDLSEITSNSNPLYTQMQSGPLDGLNGGVAAGTYQPPFRGTPARLTVHKSDRGPWQDRNVLTHEALHAAWENRPQNRSKFAEIFSKEAAPPLKDWLAKRMSVYKGFQGRPSLDNFAAMDEHMQNEVHSFVPEYSMQPYRVPFAAPTLDSNLVDYYSQFFNVANLPSVARRQEQEEYDYRRLVRPTYSSMTRLPLYFE